MKLTVLFEEAEPAWRRRCSVTQRNAGVRL